MSQFMQAIKDIISLFVYIFISPFWGKKKAILVYHSMDEIKPGLDPYKMNVTPQLFERHAEYIARHRDAYTLTFDDGFKSIFTNAFPVLKRYNIGATVFLTTDYIEGKMDFGDLFEGGINPKSLTWNEAREFSAYGIEIGSHAVTHRNIGYLGEAEANGEIAGSKRLIEERTGCRVASFSYPFGNAGSFNKLSETLIRKAGYKKAFTNIMGMDNSDSDPFKINRIRIYGTDNMFRFRMKLAGAYNWVDHLSGT